MATRKVNKTLAAEWLKDMQDELKPGDTIHTVLREVSASGMSRKIDVYRFTCVDGKIEKIWLTPRVAAICGFTFDEKSECLRVSGCGLDIGVYVVDSFARHIFPNGETFKQEWV